MIRPSPPIKHITKKYLSRGVQTALLVTVYMKGEIIMLSDTDKTKITALRISGRGYTDIAKELSINVSTVRMYCVRHHLSGTEAAKRSVCHQCGKVCTGLFCSERCRSAWRRSNGKLAETKYHHTCAGCGKPFDTAGNKNQLYCSLRCYHNHRKGGAA